MQEIEAKFYVQDLKRIEARLQNLEAHLIQTRVLEKNLRFDLPAGDLRSKGQVLRLRQDAEAKLTYKSSGTSAQGIVNRTEIEFVVEDFDMAKNFLEALGYQKFFQYNKYRTTYEFENCHIMLDELPYGNFVEIEGADINAIHRAADKLNLNMQAAISQSYSALFDRVRQTLGLTFTDLTFANFEGLPIPPEYLRVQAAD
jgi:adenylate cyclase class 2